MPHTKIGKWSVGLIGAFIVSMVLLYIFIAKGHRGGDTFFSNPALAVPLLSAGVCGIAGFVTGLIAMIKQRDRSALVYIAVCIGGLVTLWTAAEILFPH